MVVMGGRKYSTLRRRLSRLRILCGKSWPSTSTLDHVRECCRGSGIVGGEVTKDAILGIVLVTLSGFAVLGYGIEKLLEQISTSSLRTTPAEGFKMLTTYLRSLGALRDNTVVF